MKRILIFALFFLTSYLFAIRFCSAQCGLTVTFSVGPQTSPPNLNCAQDCDGTILAIPSGGGGVPYTFVWSTVPTQNIQAATGLCAGTYTVSITDGVGCETIVTQSIVAPDPVIATFTEIPSCNGQSTGIAMVDVSGGCSGLGPCPYDYTFTNVTTGTTMTGQLDSIFSFTSLAPGSYSISVTDQIPCPAATATIVVTEATLLQPSITDPNGSFSTSCSGVCDATLNGAAIGSIPPYSYSWDNGDTTSSITGVCGSAAGTTYTLTVTDSLNCIQNVNALITEPLPLVSINTQIDPIDTGCTGSATVLVSGGNSLYAYSWSDPASQTGSTAVLLCTGTYNVTIMDAMGCTIIETFVLGNVVGFNPKSTLVLIQILPNPSAGRFSIIHDGFSNNNKLFIVVYSVNGQKVLEKVMTQQEIQVDLTQMNKEVYYLQVIDEKEIRT